MRHRDTTGGRTMMAGLVAALAISAACGGAVEQDATANLSADQLKEMVLQPDDLPQGLSYESRPASPWDDLEHWVAGYRLLADLPHSVAEEGDLVCISGSLHLYDSIEAAKATWEQGEKLFQRPFEETFPMEGRWTAIPVPSLGDDSVGYFLSLRSNFCRWEDTQMEAVMVAFRKGRLWVGVVTFTLGHGASPDEAIELARKQLARIETALDE